jgi:23S rRNA (guanosine2251-2'-O)-methyltransferase
MRVKTEELCDYIVSIPMNDSVESLNASVAAALVGYEAQRKVVK